MPRRSVEEIVGAARDVLADDEHVVEYGPCWAAQLRPRLPLLFLARRQRLLALTDRHLLLFARRRRGLRPGDLVLGEPYEAFNLLQRRPARPLLQLLVARPPAARFVFEFRPRRRRLGELLAHRLDRSVPAPARLGTGVGPAGTRDAPDGTDATVPGDTPPAAS
jgi:hypothetical protein